MSNLESVNKVWEEFINVLVSKGKQFDTGKDNLYGQFVGEWDFEWVDNQGTTGEKTCSGRVDIRLGAGRDYNSRCVYCPSRKARIKIINRMQLMRLRYVMYNLIQRHGIFYIRN